MNAHLAPVAENDATPSPVPFSIPPDLGAFERSRRDARDEDAPLGDAVDVLASAGWLVAPLPVAAGGVGLGTSKEPDAIRLALDALRGLGRTDLPLARLYEGHVNAIKLVELHAGDGLRELVRERVRAGTLLGVWGAPGRDPLRVASTDPDGWTLAGAKAFASGLGTVGLAVVTVADPHESRPHESRPHEPRKSRLLLVDVDEPGRMHPEDWHASGMRATRSGGYRFDGVRLEPGRAIGAPGVYEREPWFEGGTWRYVAAHVGAMEGLVDATVSDLAARHRADDPHQRARIGRAASLAVGARALVERVAHEVETVDPSDEDATRRAVALALLAREDIEERAVALLAIVERALGMAAFDRRHPVERRRRDLGLFLRQAAPDAKLARAAETVVVDAARGIGSLW